MEDMFTISRKKDIEGNDVFDIRINAVPSNFFGYVINSSRVYWRKELEYNFDDKSVGEDVYKRQLLSMACGAQAREGDLYRCSI